MTSLPAESPPSAPSTQRRHVTCVRTMVATILAAVMSLTIEPVLFVDALYFALTDTAIRSLSFDVVCMKVQGLQSNNSCDHLTASQSAEVHAYASRLLFFGTLCDSLPSMLLVVVYSNLSDRWSRKYVILLGPLGSFLSSAVCLAVSARPDWPPESLLAASVATGLTGGYLTFLGVCLGYLSAITVSDRQGHRVVRLAVAEAFMQTSRAISASVSGHLLVQVGHSMVFVIGICLNVVNAIYILVRLDNIRPETQTATATATDDVHCSGSCGQNGDLSMEANRRRGNETDLDLSGDSVQQDCDNTPSTNSQPSNCDVILEASDQPDVLRPSQSAEDDGLCRQLGDLDVCCRERNCSGGEHVTSRSTSMFYVARSCSRLVAECVIDYTRTLTRRRRGNHRKYLVIIVIMWLVETVSVGSIYQGLSYLFLRHPPLLFSVEMYGYFRGVGWAVKGLCLTVVLPVAKRLLHVTDTSLLVLGYLSAVASAFVLGTSQFVWMAFLSQIVGLLENGLAIVQRSIGVSLVDQNEYGKLFGVMASIQAVASIIGSAVFNGLLYPATVDMFPGTAILVAGFVLLPLLPTSMWFHWKFITSE